MGRRGIALSTCPSVCACVRACPDGGIFPTDLPGPILSVFPALIVHSELKSVHPGFPVAFIF